MTNSPNKINDAETLNFTWDTLPEPARRKLHNSATQPLRSLDEYFDFLEELGVDERRDATPAKLYTERFTLP